MKLEPFGFLLVLALYFSGVLSSLLLPGVEFFCKLLQVPMIQLS